ncbi:hypothetical protein H8N00_29985 [Streptomyces sp. AC563]|uniref:hypothetical protein n=1 Tax=Streptomyces buecherae TaxID=2763006 RepID=UPI00164E47F4|nr:hypothetical protein [Streptomyces buecherae]MBC3993029.1 hypothetical protein [Streptomyces buecherae]
MVNFNQLLELDTAGMEDFTKSWNAIYQRLKEARKGFHDDVVLRLHHDGWRGEGGRAAQDYCDSVERVFDALNKQVKGLRDLIDRVADGALGTEGTKGLEGLRRKAASLQQEALEKGMTIDSDGSVNWAVATDPDSSDSQRIISEAKATAKNLEERIQTVLEFANKIDDELTYSLKVCFGTVDNLLTEGREYDALDPKTSDYVTQAKLAGIAVHFSAVKGWDESASLIKHYLDGSGETVSLDSGKMLKEIPAFQKDVNATLNSVRSSPNGRFVTDWEGSRPNINDGNSSLDWYYALNNFQYRIVGTKNDAGVSYHVEVRKRYDWGVPSEHRRNPSGGFGPLEMELEQADIARLHSVGIARDFDVVGKSQELGKKW